MKKYFSNSEVKCFPTYGFIINLLIKYEGKINMFSGLKNLVYIYPFFKKVLEDIQHQKERMKRREKFGT